MTRHIRFALSPSRQKAIRFRQSFSYCYGSMTKQSACGSLLPVKVRLRNA